MASKLTTLILQLAATLVLCAPSFAQTSRGHLQEEGIAPPFEQILRSQNPDASDPRFVRAYREAIVASIKREMATPGRVEELIVKTYGQISPAKMKLFARNMQTILKHEGYYDMLVNLTLPMVMAKVPMEQIKEVMSATALTIPLKGLPRLNEQDQMAFIAYTARLMGTVPPEICKRITNNDIGAQESAYIERSYLVTRSDEEFTAVADLYLRAIEYELSDFPYVPKYTEAQMESAQTIFAKALVERMQKRMPIEQVSDILNDMKKASAKEVCATSLDIFRTLLDMPSPFRKWQLQAFVNEAAR